MEIDNTTTTPSWSLQFASNHEMQTAIWNADLTATLSVTSSGTIYVMVVGEVNGDESFVVRWVDASVGVPAAGAEGEGKGEGGSDMIFVVIAVAIAVGALAVGGIVFWVKNSASRLPDADASMYADYEEVLIPLSPKQQNSCPLPPWMDGIEGTAL